MTKSKKIIYSALSAAILAIIVLLAIFPERYAKCCLSGLELWLYFVLPSLFPFFVLTALLTKLGVAERAAKKLSPLCERAFKLPGIASYCFAMSALSGYPVGSRMIADLKESRLISAPQATRMSALCSTSGPLFVIGSVGAAMFKNGKIGTVLFFSHLAAVLLVCLIAARFAKPEPAQSAPPKRLAPPDNILYECVYGAVTSILCVGAFIAVFYILTQILADFYLLLPLQSLLALILSPFENGSELAAALSQGLLEATHGCKLLAECKGFAAVPLAAFTITFGGASIIAQQTCYFQKAGVKMKYFFAMKIIQSFLSAGICALLCFLFSITA